MPHGLVTPGATIQRPRGASPSPTRICSARCGTSTSGSARPGEVEAETPELKDRAAALRREVLANLEPLLDQLQSALEANGVTVHRCATPEDARRVVLDLARREGVARVVKSKSMATEEIDLADTLEANGITALETDLGEYIVQLAGERPSHIITPVIHKTLDQITDVLSREAGESLPVEREQLTAWAREWLRPRFVDADMAITGANFAVAETGTIVLVTNEGNGRYCTSLPRIQVCVMGIEKVLPRFADLATVLPVLTRSATGQALIELRDDADRPAATRRDRRSRAAPRRLPRPQPESTGRHAVRGHARVHPLRGVPQRLPRVPADRWPRVRLGVPGADGQDPDATSQRG